MAEKREHMRENKAIVKLTEGSIPKVMITFAVPVWPEIRTVILSYPITWSVTSVIFVIYYLQGGWLRRQIVKAGYAPEKRQAQKA